VKHHLQILHDQLLKSNQIRIIGPYSCVKLTYLSHQIEMPIMVVEKKLFQMTLNGNFQGILDQGQEQLVVYKESDRDLATDKGSQFICSMDNVVTSLFERSKALQTVMM
jgi:26S proteasome regulatory subunit N6